MSKFCPNCGEPIEEGEQFCINCGTRLDTQPKTHSENSYVPVPPQPARIYQPQGSGSQQPQQPYPFEQPYQQPPKKGKVILIIGLSIGGVLLGCLAVAVIFFINWFTSPAEEIELTQKPARVEPVTDVDGKYVPNDYGDIDWSTLEYGDEKTAADFSYTDGWKTMSSSANRVTDFDSVVGFWKAVMITDPESKTSEGKTTDYFNVEIAGSPGDSFVIINWDRRVNAKTGEVQELRGSAIGLSGAFTNGGIKASNGSTIEITDFWKDNGTEYAVGEYLWTDGTKGYFGLVRESKGE